MTQSPQNTIDKIPIRRPDGSIVMVDVATALEEREQGAEISTTPHAGDARDTMMNAPTAHTSVPTPKSIPQTHDDATAASEKKAKPLTVPGTEQDTKKAPTPAAPPKKSTPKKTTEDHVAPAEKKAVTQSSTPTPEHGATAEALKEKIQKLAGSVAAPPPQHAPHMTTTQTSDVVKATDDQPAPIPQEATKQPASIDWQASVEKVIASVDMGLFDESHEARLRNIILSRLRDVRDVLQTREALQKDRSAGGLGLAESDAARVLAAIDAEYARIHSKEHSQAHEQAYKKVVDPFRPKAELDALAEAELPYMSSDPYLQTIAQHYSGKDMPETNEELVEDTTVKVAKPAPIELKPQKKEVSEQKTKKFVTPTEADSLVKSGKPTVKPTMQDVVAGKRLMSPIDELKSMRLIDFRRLGKTTDERLQRVRDIIHDLEEVSFTKKVEAIKAWRLNPLYQQYVALGSESLSTGKGVMEVIQAKEQVGEETLSVDEFEKLSDFNKNLRY